MLPTTVEWNPKTNWRRARTCVVKGFFTSPDSEGEIRYYIATEGQIWGPEFDTHEEAFDYLKKMFRKYKVTE